MEIRTEPGGDLSRPCWRGTASTTTSATGCSKRRRGAGLAHHPQLRAHRGRHPRVRRGLTALTGETGAGKTLLTRALGLLMGERAEEGLVGQRRRRGPHPGRLRPRDRATWRRCPADLRELAGLEGPGEIIVTRRLGKTGRNRCYINDSAVTLTAMAGARRAACCRSPASTSTAGCSTRATSWPSWTSGPGPDALELAAGVPRGPFDAAQRERPASGGEPAGAEASDCGRSICCASRSPSWRRADSRSRTRRRLQAEQRVLSRAEELQRNLGLAAELLKSDGIRDRRRRAARPGGGAGRRLCRRGPGGGRLRRRPARGSLRASPSCHGSCAATWTA